MKLLNNVTHEVLFNSSILAKRTGTFNPKLDKSFPLHSNTMKTQGAQNNGTKFNLN